MEISIIQHTLENRLNWPIRMDLRFPAQGSSYPTIIVCHGFKGFKDWGFFPYLCTELSKAGFFTLCFNFSGNGIGDEPEVFTELDKFAQNSFSLQQEDLYMVIDQLCKMNLPASEKVDINRLGILGHSMGGGLAVLKASRDDRLKALVTWAGVSSLDRFPEDCKKMWREQGYFDFLNARTNQNMRINVSLLDDLRDNNASLSVQKAVPSLLLPWLIVHGDSDESVVPAEAENLAQWSDGKARLETIEGGSHTFGAKHPFFEPTAELNQAVGATCGFFTETLK